MSSRSSGRKQPLETIRFAGSNHLLVGFEYDGKRRVAEPYSLRQAGTGNLLLYAWELGAPNIKAFNAAKIVDVKVSDKSFQPRYQIELATGGGLGALGPRKEKRT